MWAIMNKALLPSLLGLLLPLQLQAATPAEDAAATVVIYNMNDRESKGLADFYCAARGINPAQEIPLAAPTTDEIPRNVYDSSIAGPIREMMVERGYWIISKDIQGHDLLAASRIHYAVLMRGVPLKIAECTNYPGDNATIQSPPYGNCTAASVDSELSILGLQTPQISGVINNPFCITKLGSTKDAKPLTSPSHLPPQLLLVGRLDGPSVESIKAMINNGLKAEKEGLWGWGYTDVRSITDPGFVLGDQFIRKAAMVMRKNGIPVLCDDLPETFQSGFPITDAAAYFGWYSENIVGPFRDPAFHFLPGAVAAHLHSFSATTLHDPLKGWTGPLIGHGASASIGNVYEPYLVFTTDFGTLEEKLLSGCNLAESYYASQPVLSWMSILVGDPLYRPYAAFDSAGKGIASTTVWQEYRRIILSHHGDVLKAAHDLGVAARRSKESLYLEALGAAQEESGVLVAAGASFRDAAKLEKNPNIKFRLLLEQVRILEKQGKLDKGLSLLTQESKNFENPAQKALLVDWMIRMNPVKPTPTPTITHP
jgi:uncharacterized protein (TIGR03790 family)